MTVLTLIKLKRLACAVLLGACFKRSISFQGWLWKICVTAEDCIAAAKLANADRFIRTLLQGYDTVLKGDGSVPSQGQWQLISIAHAAVSDMPVRILDEAASPIDARSESLVQDGMDKLMRDRTYL